MIIIRSFLYVILSTIVLNLSLPCLGLANTNIVAGDLIKKFDTSSYHPELYGLKDLSVDMKITNLAKELSENLNNLPLNKEITFRFYWLISGKLDVVVLGLPSGFAEVRGELAKFAISKFGLLIPVHFGEVLKNYKLKFEDKGPKKIIKGIDSTHTNLANEVTLTIDEQEKISEMKSQLPVGIETMKFNWIKSGWGYNKWFLKGMEVETDYGTHIKKIEYIILYEKYANIALTSKVNVYYEIIPIDLAQDSSARKVGSSKEKISSEIIFSDFKINEGVAQKYFHHHKGI